MIFRSVLHTEQLCYLTYECVRKHLYTSKHVLVLTYLRMMFPTFLSSDQSVRTSSRSLWWTNITHRKQQVNNSSSKMTPSQTLRTPYLYSGVNVVDVGDAAKYRLNFFWGQNGAAHLSLFFQWKLEKLQIKNRYERSTQRHTNTTYWFHKTPDI